MTKLAKKVTKSEEKKVTKSAKKVTKFRKKVKKILSPDDMPVKGLKCTVLLKILRVRYCQHKDPVLQAFTIANKNDFYKAILC